MTTIIDLKGDTSVSYLQEVTEKYIQSKNQEAIVLVHASWCGHCKQFMNASEGGQWEQFVNAVRSKMNVIQIEADALEKYNMGLNVSSFPTLLHIKNGEIRIFSEKRELKNLLDFVNVEKQQQHNQFGGGRRRSRSKHRKSKKTRRSRSVKRRVVVNRRRSKRRQRR
jgi:thiol-disulfide isomerase/thioredoxin